jgi:hypothetical protein
MAAITRYWFNPDTEACETFFWGGCGANANMFETAESCEASCGDGAKDTCPPTVPYSFTACRRPDDAEVCNYFGGCLCGITPDGCIPVDSTCELEGESAFARACTSGLWATR